MNKKIERYMTMLSAAGMDDREVTRAGFYAQKYGLKALSNNGNHCVVFTEPTCGDWNCVKPDHQKLEIQENGMN